MAILKYANQSGVVYAYESISEWDPVKKQSRSKRKCLGRVDPETGEIIPTSGKKGRPPKNTKKTPVPVNTGETSSDPAFEKLMADYKKLETENRELLSENKRLKAAVSKIKEELAEL